ncbi:MAG TPA: PQQ-binding-like beta-propeller repeat protein [Terriglobia bacterium]|nr:PQQ-binding-like beta-propeller repeat protein [Terriglobia bacterium]
MMPELVFALALLATQNPANSTPDVLHGQKLYASNCAGCHGSDFRGTDQGPGLTANSRVRKMSVQRLGTTIKNGIPTSGMPPFDLSAEDLDALITFIRSLNSVAAESNVPGSPEAGRQFFFGKGECGSCHMVLGQGRAIGPDLSNLGNEKTVGEIQSALREPSADITPGYEMVTVKVRDGNSVRGFARNRSNFDILVQDLEGKFHLLEEGQIVSILDEKQSVMPPVQATPEELQDLVAYLSRLTGVKPGALHVPRASKTGGIDFERILHPNPGDWLTYNGNLNANRYSELSEITTTNVRALELKWIFTVPLWKNLLPDNAYFNENMKYFGLEATPLVADGIMYITGPNSVYALDALTGREIWNYSRPRTPALVGDASLGTNRGVAILGENIFRVTDDAHLIALNRVTGKLVWEQVMPDELQHYGSTVAPLIVKDLVVAGVSGGDWGIRGFIAAFKAATGERVWRTWTIPAQGEPGSETWGPKGPVLGGGATWSTGSYDPETDTLYWPTGNPWPDSDDRDRPGENLYTDSILALDPSTGRMKWYYQFTPHDTKDQDANQPPVLVDTRFQGQDRKLMLFANRNGFFYVLDRINGKILLAKPFVKKLTWASGIGADGRPQLQKEGDQTCPDTAANWNATAFSPKSRLYFVVALEKCRANVNNESWKRRSTRVEPGRKYLRAINIDSGEIVWEMQQTGPTEGKRDAGMLATAGGLLFYGDPSGDFVAMDERTGKPLWHFSAGAENKTSPMTYMVGGKQFVAIAIGPNILCFGLPGERAMRESK